MGIDVSSALAFGVGWIARTCWCLREAAAAAGMRDAADGGEVDASVILSL